MRQRYIQDPVTLELVPIEQWHGPSTSKTAYVVPDIQPYKSMIDGSMITSRSHHRAHLAQHGCFEIGNEISHAVKTARPQLKVDREGIRNTLRHVLASKGY